MPCRPSKKNKIKKPLQMQSNKLSAIAKPFFRKFEESTGFISVHYFTYNNQIHYRLGKNISLANDYLSRAKKIIETNNLPFIAELKISLFGCYETYLVIKFSEQILSN